MPTPLRKIQHLFLRAGFGETPAHIHALQGKSLSDITVDLFSTSKDYKDIQYLPFPLNESQEKKGATPFLLVKMILKSKKEMEELNSEWLFKMTHTKAVLREKLAFFWHNHFATSVPFAYLMQMQNNTLRKLALAKFGDLLHAISKDPAMLLYLNNQQNKKDHPNENFAREVMELFTLGIGHYTEKDIREAARAFTGWSVNAKGEFVFLRQHHDDGVKEFLGRQGPFNGEDILNILLEQKQTATYLVTKLYREYVNPEVNTARVDQLAQEYYNSGYDTEKLLRSIFSSEWFYDEENIGVKIASPVELLVRYKKLVDLQFKKEKSQIDLQKALGQVLFFPPNVAGWKGGTYWIDSSSLLIRLNMPQYIVHGTSIGLKSKPSFEEMPEERSTTLDNATIGSDWKPLLDYFQSMPGENLKERLIENLIQCSVQPGVQACIRANENSRIQMMADVMSLPQFQLI